MNKKHIVSSVLASILICSAVQAQALDRETEKDLITICKALKSNNKSKLHRVISNSRWSYKIIAEGLVCNGMDPVTFALHNDAHKTAQFFAHKSKLDYQTMLAKR